MLPQSQWISTDDEIYSLNDCKELSENITDKIACLW